MTSGDCNPYLAVRDLSLMIPDCSTIIGVSGNDTQFSDMGTTYHLNTTHATSGKTQILLTALVGARVLR